MITNEIYKYFADFVFKKTGIQYLETDYYRLDSRINQLIEKYDCKDANEVYRLYKDSLDSEKERFLIDICTNNETYFFRDTKPFDALALDIMPELRQKHPSDELKIWSCASSTGQEPLSILMTIMEKLPNEVKFNFKATDISSQALNKCSKGIYTNLDFQRGLPIQLLVKYFESVEGSNWKAKSNLTSKVEYGHFNLLTDLFPPSSYHVIFCRNVLIYQNQVNKNSILEKIEASLKPGGYLILGAGESLIGSSINLAQKNLSGAMVFQKES